MQILKTGKSGCNGFSFIEIIVVISIISILTLVSVPRVASYLSSRRKNTITAMGFLNRLYDENYLSENQLFLVINLNQSDGFSSDNDIFKNRNSFSAVKVQENYFEIVNNRYLQPINFPGTFSIESVKFRSDKEIQSGFVVLPYSQKGIVDDILIYIAVTGRDYITIFIPKFQRRIIQADGKKDFHEL